MKDRLSFDDADELRNPPPHVTEFDRVVEAALSRRGFMGVMTFGLGSFLVGTSVMTRMAEAATDRFGFDGIAAATDDTVLLPDGFEWHSVVHWGDPLFSDAPDFDAATRLTAESQLRSFGDNNDGMSVFSDGNRSVLVANNEYINEMHIWGNRGKTDAEGKMVFGPETDDDVTKGMAAHGVSIAEIALGEGGWQIVKDSPVNRRITAMTEMALTGPAAGHALVQTKADPAGTKVLGTWNNCGNGQTPWGTYLTCEENFNGYFHAPEGTEVSDEMARYGVSTDSRYGWERVDPRFDLTVEPNEANRHGYVVEIDPFDPASVPKKRSALGRFKHENADVVVARDGRVVVYLGDDERGEFLYRFVSAGRYAAGGDNHDLLADGTLFAATFTPDGRGQWMALTPETTGMEAAEIAVHTRQAASKVGATTMDRPEWVASNPRRVESYVALTNNSRRESGKTNAGGDKMEADGGPNPRDKNVYGQILRWVPDNGDHAADAFGWDLFALAGNPTVHQDANAGSPNINAGNLFNSPDGLMFDDNGMLWIQTDGNYSNEGDFAGMGNNQMLVGDPDTGEIRRFLVGPKECEITGHAWSPDRRTLFVGIQHPGEDGGSSWPGGAGSVPRSGVIAIARTDGGRIG
jgi:secreted PhoX family phosphatase